MLVNPPSPKKNKNKTSNECHFYNWKNISSNQYIIFLLKPFYRHSLFVLHYLFTIFPSIEHLPVSF